MGNRLGSASTPPAWDILGAVGRSYGFVFQHLGEAAQATWAYTLLLLAVWLGMRRLTPPGPQGSEASESIGHSTWVFEANSVFEWGYEGLALLFETAIFVAWARRYLIREPIPLPAPRIDRFVLVCLLGQLVFYGPGFLLERLGFPFEWMMMLFLGIGADDFATFSVTTVLVPLLIYFGTRICLIIPSAALSGRLHLVEIWKATRGRFLSLFGVFIIFWLLFVIVQIILTLPIAGISSLIGIQTFLESAIYAELFIQFWGICISFLMSLLLATFLADIYGQARASYGQQTGPLLPEGDVD